MEHSNSKTVSYSRLLTRKEAAEYLGTTEGTLAVWACNKRYDLPVIKVGRLVKYSISDIEAFIQRRTTCKADGGSYAR